VNWQPMSELYGPGSDEGIAFIDHMYEGQVFIHGSEGWKVVLWDILDGAMNARIVFDYMDVASLEEGKALLERTVRGEAV